MLRYLVLIIGLLFVVQACKSPAPKPPARVSNEPIIVPYQAYVPPTKAALEQARLLMIRKLDSLRHIDLTKSVYTGLLYYPMGYTPWMGRRGPGYIDPPVPRTTVDTVMRIETHQQFMGQIMDEQNQVSVPQMATFRNVDFNCYVNFSQVTFEKGSNFTGVIFHRKTKLKQFKSLENAYFSFIRSRYPLIFDRPVFDKVYFTDIKLDSNSLELFDAKFKQLTAQRIYGGHLKLSVDSAHELIISKSHPARLSIGGNIDVIRLDSVYTDHELDLTKISDVSGWGMLDPAHYPKHGLFLRSVDLSRINLDYNHFRLLLKDADSTLMPPNEVRLLYEGLLKNFKDRGRTDSYELLDIEYQQYRDASPFKWQSRLNGWWWNFGYDHIKIFTHILQFLGVYILITFFFLQALQKNVYTLEAFEKTDPSGQRNIHGDIYQWKSFRKFFKRLWYATAYAVVVFLLLSVKIEQLKLLSNWKYVTGTVFVIVMHISGLICLGYVANFILQR